jgi:signal transduction histidine kinase
MVRGGDGRLWIATETGTLWMDPARIVRNVLAPGVAVRSLTADGHAHLDPSTLELAAGTANIEIDFAVLSLADPHRVRARYMLEGFDRDWVDAGARRQAFYTNLPPGTYRFRVIGANNDGVWNHAGATLDFTIPPTFVQSRWFVLLCATLVLVAFGAIYRWRVAQIARRIHARLDERAGERERIARELHDTLLQGFTGITLQLDGVRSSLAESSAPLAEDLSTILQGADRTLRDAREMVWDMRQPGLADADLGAALQAASAALPNPDGIVIEHRVTGTPRPLSPAVATACLRIGKEAMVNALAHSKAATIAVSLDYETHHVRLEVRDDGCGATPEQLEVAAARGHWGIAGMRERARTAGGTLTVDTTPGRGTRVVMVVAG